MVNIGEFYFQEYINWRYINIFGFLLTYFTYYFIFQVYADGYVPKEFEFMVLEQHPTQLNITLYTAKVNNTWRYFNKTLK